MYKFISQLELRLVLKILGNTAEQQQQQQQNHKKDRQNTVRFGMNMWMHLWLLKIYLLKSVLVWFVCAELSVCAMFIAHMPFCTFWMATGEEKKSTDRKNNKF